MLNIFDLFGSLSLLGWCVASNNNFLFILHFEVEFGGYDFSKSKSSMAARVSELNVWLQKPHLISTQAAQVEAPSQQQNTSSKLFD